jgi:phosphatidylserine/phosphatidylglycerophosphate/cardiolipin synthase-like enzyme
VRLFVFPDDGIAPLLELMESATRQVDLYVFELDSAEIERRVTDAARRGVRVRAIVESNPAGRAVQASQTMARLRRAGVHVKPAGRPFSKTHAKVVVADGAQAWVGTGNLVDAWRERRDYAVLTRQPETVRAVARIFEEDWLGVSSALPASPVGSIVAAGTPRSPVDPRANVVASPQNGRAAVTAFLTAARWSLSVEHDQLEDLAVLDTLAKRSRAGVDVRVVLSDGEEGRRAARSLQLRPPEIRVRLLAEPRVHAKLIIADEARLLVGSHNLTKESLDSQREIGLIVEDAEAVGTAVGVFRRDFEGVGETDGGQLVPIAVTERQPFLRGFVAGAVLPGAAALVWALRGGRP